MSDEAVRRELRKTDDTISAAIGFRPTLFRPPYGSITTRQKHWIHDEFGYRIITWDVDPLDWKRPGASVVCNRILKETRAGSIVLSHDIHPGTIEAMPATFDQLQAKGIQVRHRHGTSRHGASAPTEASRNSSVRPQPRQPGHLSSPLRRAFPTASLSRHDCRSLSPASD